MIKEQEVASVCLSSTARFKYAKKVPEAYKKIVTETYFRRPLEKII